MSTGTTIALLAVGGILRFAVAPGSPGGLNFHVVGVVLMLAGAVGLVLALLGRGPLRRRPLNPRGNLRVRYRRAPPTLTRQRGGDQNRPPAAADRLAYQDKPPQ